LFIDIHTRQVSFAGAAANSTGAWTTQGARYLFLQHADQLAGSRALVRDRGSQLIDAFDEVYATKASTTLKTAAGGLFPPNSLRRKGRAKEALASDGERPIGH
jgi:hypothetical protein